MSGFDSVTVGSSGSAATDGCTASALCGSAAFCFAGTVSPDGCSAGVRVWVAVGVGASCAGVVGVEPLVFGFAASRFFSSVFKKTLIVVRSDL